MSDDTPAPQAASDLPNGEVQSVPTDSAPPPQSQVTTSTVGSGPSAPPPRDYLHHPAPIPQLPPAYAPNSSIPQFIRTLAFVVFVVGGTTSAAVTWLYKSVIYPRLVLALQARTRLHAAHLTSYDAFLTSLRGMRDAPGFRSLRSPSDEVSEEQATDATPEKDDLIKDEKEKVNSSEVEQAEENVDASTEAAELKAQQLPSPSLVLLPLQTTLSSLASALPSSSTGTSLPVNISHPPYPAFAEAINPAEGLLGALSTLNSYIETESYAVVTAAYRTYGASSTTSGSQDRKPLLDAVSNLKAEIRSVKGALLNRRNFTALAPRGEVVA